MYEVPSCSKVFFIGTALLRCDRFKEEIGETKGLSWNIPILRRHIFGLFQTQPPTLAAQIQY